ncbi:radical SAM protein [Pseudonocardia asaccharolytica]|uniref:Radical SAM core domain-containing protein n=1 Tax=Pseudonocardia asaccharolytica DSM 44247 = NBRC 16224 TaxID=1123024 RepID=A0A511DA94_9PSEU|nr:radical SAM protein [Pseudonocardia asaccharolytica]GEL19868.1 hypothetical protein PA7_37050 [Pseudonocardia asaccharolytica DSM 44247 = NBRC 16224]
MLKYVYGFDEGSRVFDEIGLLPHANAGALSQDELTRLRAVCPSPGPGPEVVAVARLADELRTAAVGDTVTYVRDRDINYTNVCAFRCAFCGFAKGPLSLNLRGRPYLLSPGEFAERAREAWDRGATAVCLQGGIHPSFDGSFYLDVTAAVHATVPELHIHGFTALEVTEGARRRAARPHVARGRAGACCLPDRLSRR